MATRRYRLVRHATIFGVGLAVLLFLVSVFHQLPQSTSSVTQVRRAAREVVNDGAASLLPPPILATNISDEIHLRFLNATNSHGIPLANLSSVDYIARCGLGHRLSRMANAALVAKQLNLALHVYWGKCGDETEVFQHLFGPQQDLTQVTSMNQHVSISNDVAGTKTILRRGPDKSCLCRQEYIDAHREFYKDLRNRFRYKRQVDAFVKQSFANHTVLGMHIRAGNGEEGDFTKKGRGIEDLPKWVHEASMRIKEIVEEEKREAPPLLYIASDTPSVIDMFRSELVDVMPVIDFPQERAPEGQGVFFGETGAKQPADLACIRGWENAVMDMILLSHADLLIASRMSSFAQTMPMSLVFGRENHKVQKPKCELNFDATTMVCSKTYLEWCCDVSQEDIRPTTLKESIKMPPPGGLNLSMFELKDRPYDMEEGKNTYLPYYWRTKALARSTMG